jgi:hypothetical protein
MNQSFYQNQQNICLFCKSKDGPFLSEEHIIPESLGSNKLILPKGVVCDECNNGVLAELDNALCNFDPFLFYRTYLGIKNKDGEVPVAKFNTINMENPTGRHVKIELPKMTNKHFEKTSSGAKIHWKGKKRMTIKNQKIIARALYKIGLELLYLDHGFNFVYSAKLDKIREIVLGNKDFEGYFLLGTNNPPATPLNKAGITYRFFLDEISGEQFAIFEFNYLLVKILFDIDRRRCKLNNGDKFEGFNVIKF